VSPHSPWVLQRGIARGPVPDRAAIFARPVPNFRRRLRFNAIEARVSGICPGIGFPLCGTLRTQVGHRAMSEKCPVAEVADASGPVQDRADVLGFDGLP
jgi:hypothetical protein